ncbi:TetR/AcrR family transcriptional regulator [Salidesulfovibrio brasiliensis]
MHKTTREERKRLTRNRILEAARELFAEKGPDRTSMREIATVAGVAVGTVNLHFGDKFRLMHEAMYGEFHDMSLRALATIPDGPTLERLMYLVEYECDYYEEHIDTLGPLMRESLFVRGEAGQAYSDQMEWYAGKIAEIMEEGKQRGELRADVECEKAAWAFISHYLTGILTILRSERFDRDEVLGFVRMLQEQLFNGLLSR